MRDLIHFDPMTGVSCFLEWQQDGKARIVHEADESFIQPVLDRNATLRNDVDRKKRGIKNSFMHAAEIPPAVQIKWLTEEGIDVLNPDDWPRVRLKLNSPDYAYLKVIDGRV